jgi:uncharacterized membrane protein YhaH (DUF805 family)
MGSTQAVKTCLRKFIHLGGRASRSEYWWFYLFVILATVAAQTIDSLIFGFPAINESGRYPLTLIVSFVLFWPTLSAGWRRMHDTGHPGWYVILPQAIAMAGLIAFMVGVFGFGLVEGATGDTQTYRGIAGVVGVAGLVALWAAVLAAFVLKLWWLTRPGDPAPNAYGPPPDLHP